MWEEQVWQGEGQIFLYPHISFEKSTMYISKCTNLGDNWNCKTGFKGQMWARQKFWKCNPIEIKSYETRHDKVIKICVQMKIRGLGTGAHQCLQIREIASRGN